MEVPVIVGEDAIVRRAAKLADRLASTTHAIFISGESGTGREHTARFLHARGPRAVAPFSIFDCGAAVRGACVDELSARMTASGTLVIDNCDALSADESAAVAALIGKEGAAARIVLKSSRITVELADRIAALSLCLPPLRLRRADVPALARHFADRWARQRRVAAPTFSKAAMLGLWRHDWPGNVRELREEVRAALERCEDGVVGPSQLPARLFPGPRRAEAGSIGGGGARIPNRSRAAALSFL